MSIKKKNIYGIQNNLQELKEKLEPNYLFTNTSIFRGEQNTEESKARLKMYIESWIIPLINDTIDMSYDK